MTQTIVTVKLEEMQSPQTRRQGVCVALKLHFRAFLNPHSRKTRVQKTAGEKVAPILLFPGNFRGAGGVKELELPAARCSLLG